MFPHWVSLDTQIINPTNQNSIIVPKVVKPTNRKTLLETRIINSPMSPPSLPTHTHTHTQHNTWIQREFQKCCFASLTCHSYIFTELSRGQLFNKSTTLSSPCCHMQNYKQNNLTGRLNNHPLSSPSMFPCKFKFTLSSKLSFIIF